MTPVQRGVAQFGSARTVRVREVGGSNPLAPTCSRYRQGMGHAALAVFIDGTVARGAYPWVANPVRGVEPGLVSGHVCSPLLTSHLWPGGSPPLHLREWAARLAGTCEFARAALCSPSACRAGEAGLGAVTMNFVCSRSKGRFGSILVLGSSPLLLLIALASVRAAAGSPLLVKDIKPGAPSSEPASLIHFGDRLYFSADDGTYGEELWTSNGTAAGTSLVKDINLGAGRAFPAELTAAGSLLFFRAEDGTSGRELWKSDGTGAGTSLVKDINPGAVGSIPVELAALGSTLFFQADDGSHGRELWKSDGTRAGTALVKDIWSGSDGSEPALMVDLNGLLVFRAREGSHGSELWKSDGTAAGTVILRDIYPGLTGSEPAELTAAGGVLFFSAKDASSGVELWKSDGTEVGTVLLKDIRPGSESSFPTGLTVMNGRLYFAAHDGSSGVELWRSDGTAAGTVRVADISPGAGSSNPDSLIAIGATLFFSASDVAHGAELWRSDGSAAGTALVRDIKPGTESSFPYYPAEGHGALFFSADDGSHGTELWRSDGRTAGTALVADIYPGSGSAGPWYLTKVGDRLFFRAEDGTWGRELWAVQIPTADLLIAKAVAPAIPLAPNAPITYTLTYQNHGDAWALGVTIADPLPTELANASVHSTSPITPAAGLPYTWQVGDLAPGAGGTITVKGIIDPQHQAGYAFTNTATIAARNVETNTSDNQAGVGVRINFPPVAEDNSYNAAEDTPLAVAAPGILANDHDAEGTPLTALLEAPPAVGTLALSPDGAFLYTPPANWYGVATFAYHASDGIAQSGRVAVTLNVSSVNDPPLAADDAYSTAEETLLSVPGPGVLANDHDVEHDPLTAVLDSPPASGTLVLNANGAFTYAPAPDFSGVLTFRYHASDGGANSNSATARLTVNPVVDAPVASNDTYSTPEDSPLAVGAPGVLANDSDADGNPLFAILDVPPVDGTLVFRQDGSFTYTPVPDYHGAVTFSYYARDGLLNSSTALVRIYVTPVNDSPVAADDSYDTPEDTLLTIPAPGLLGNDMDPDGDGLTVVLDTLPQKGTLTGNRDGSFTYRPEVDYFGVQTFAYYAYDGMVNSTRATVTLRIAAVNDAPKAADDRYATAEDTALDQSAPGVLLNDTDLEGDPLTARLTEPPASGIAVLRENGSLHFTPAPDFSGDVTLIYRAHDGQSDSQPATAIIHVAAVNDAPDAVDDSYRMLDDYVLKIGPPGVLGNDWDADGDPLKAVLESPPPSGILTLDPAGSFSYSPTVNLPGVFSFTYQSEDGMLRSNTATVMITVKEENIPPVASPDRYDTVEDVPLRIGAPGVLGNDEDEWGDPLTAVLENEPLEGDLSLSSDGALIYTPTLNFHGSMSFTYHATDGIANSNSVAVTLRVAPANDPPLAVADWYMTGRGRVLVVPAPGVLGNDTDVEGDDLTAILQGGPTAGGLGLASSGALVYIPGPGYAGTVTFSYRVYDGVAYSVAAEVEIEVVEQIVYLPTVSRQHR